MNRIMMLLTLLVSPSLFWGLSVEENVAALGVLTLLPPVLSIVLAFVTRRVYFSLFVGIWSGALLLFIPEGFAFGDIYHSFEKVIDVVVENFSDSWNASIMAQLVAIGGMIAVIGKNGGAHAIAEAIAKKAKTARSAQVFTSLTALFIFFDDYASCLITGPVMQPVTDKLKVSREKLAFLVDATAAPISGIALISTWIGYELSVIKDAFEIAGVSDPNAYAIFIETIPYRFYIFFMLGFIAIIILLNKDFGPMLKAEQRARQTGVTLDNSHQIGRTDDSLLVPNEGITHKVSNALVPILTLIFASFLGIWYDGYRALVADGVDLAALAGYDYVLAILENCDVILVIFKAAVLGSIVAVAMSAINKTMSFFDAIEVWVVGARNMLDINIILLLAWTIASIIKELGASVYLIQILQGNIPPVIVPIITFILASVIAFSTGTSFGTMGILMPLAVPLMATLSGDPTSPLTMITVGTVLTGAIVGDHCSPISDTTVLSSGGAGCPLIDHVDTQIPYVLTVTAVSTVCGYLFVAMGMPTFLSYIIGFAAMVLIVHTLGKNPETEKM